MKVKVEKEWQKLASLLNRENDDLPSDALDVLDEEKKKIFKIIDHIGIIKKQLESPWVIIRNLFK